MNVYACALDARVCRRGMMTMRMMMMRRRRRRRGVGWQQ
jgi:hypothetical protein